MGRWSDRCNTRIKVPRSTVSLWNTEPGCHRQSATWCLLVALTDWECLGSEPQTPSILALPERRSLFLRAPAIRFPSEQVGFGPLCMSFGRYRAAGVDAGRWLRIVVVHHSSVEASKVFPTMLVIFQRTIEMMSYLP
jgi:hypothetical protein